MKKLSLFLMFLCISSYLAGTTIRIFNDSPYVLHAKISDANGTVKGIVQLAKRATVNWHDQDYNATWSLSPYSVTFVCPTGKVYGVYGNISPGALVSATQSVGPQYCEKEKKKNKQQQTPELSPEHLHKDPNWGPP